MAWLESKKRKNPATGRQTAYWSIQWRDERGRTRTRAVGFCSSSEAKTALKVAEAKLALGESIAPDAPTPSEPSSSTALRTPTLGSYLDEVYLPVVARDKSPKTHEVEGNAGKALKGILGDVPLDQITYALIDAYVSERRDLGRKSRTLILELRTLSGALRHAYDCDLIAAIPKLPRLTDRDRSPAQYLTPEESVALLDALRPLDEQPFEVTRGRPPIRRDRATYLAVLMALNTGARRNEIMTRTWGDVRWELGPCGTLIIGAKPEVGFQVKTRRERAIPLTPELRAELLAWRREQGEPSAGWVFPSPKDPSRPRQTFRQAVQRMHLAISFSK